MVSPKDVIEETDVVEDSSDVESACGDPQVEPRVGDEFQVDIPPMMSASKRELFLSTNLASDDDSSYPFLVGLPVQVMWIDKHQSGDDNVDMNQSLKSLKAKRRHCSTKIRGQSDKNLESKKQRLNLEAVPEILSSSWEDFEVDNFVLGLYTFGKNFTQIKRFMENKGIGEIILFYYSKFYNSGKYNIWFNSHKKQNRKFVSGRKLYSGWRQQMLLSRLIPSIADESHKQMLVNVSKSFAEGNINLEKYVTAVKDLVGLRLLVDAVAIGKEKEEDLTVLSAAPVKTKSWFTVNPKPSSVPSMGAYTSLTASDIIDQLTGCSRLSKARCSDIFWEAVWPRLLARGWHSEQPKDRGYFTSKDSIVFIVPGVKRFSRGKLVKGDHYFDSVSDILTKVALEPELLEFETGGEIREAATNEFAGEENSSSDQSDEESSPSDSQRHHYLRSPCSNRGTQQMKFTVVDTSSAAGGKLCYLRNLKAENTVSESKICVRKKKSSVQVEVPLDSHNVEMSQTMPMDVKNQVDDPMLFTIVDTSLNHREKSSGFRGWRHLPGGDDKKRGHVGADYCIKEETLEKVNEPSKRSVKNKFTPQGEADYHSGNSPPLLKRRRLSACIRKEESLPRESPVFKHLQCDDTVRTVCPESNHLNLCAVQHHNSTCEEMNEDKERNETMLSVDQPKKTGTGLSEIQEMSEIEPNGLNSITGVDVNYSPEEIKTEQEPDRLCSVSDADKKRDSNDLEPEQAVVALRTTQELGSSEQQQQQQQPDQQINTDGPRRQSTRKRPLTTRALEAIESGFLTTKRMKSSTTKPRNRQSSRKKEHSAKACNRAQLLSDNGSADLEERGEDGNTSVKKATACKPLDQIEDSKPSSLLHEAATTTENPKLPPIVLKLSLKRG